MGRLALVAVLAGILASGAGARDAKPNLHRALNELRAATLDEQNTLADLSHNLRDWKKIRQESFDGFTRVLDVRNAVGEAGKDGEVEGDDLAQLNADVREAVRDDSAAYYDGAAKSNAVVVGRETRSALRVKHALERKLVELISTTRCETDKQFQVYAIPAGSTGAYSEVYPHGIPHNARNVRVTFVDLATGRAPAAEVFPGQTWKATVKGYQPNGQFVVRIDVSGTGFGQPDANTKKWKVVVTYDC